MAYLWSFILYVIPCLGQMIGFHNATFDDNGNLVPWMPLKQVVDLQMSWYLSSPPSDRNDLPYYIWSTFVDGNHLPIVTKGCEVIPAMQDGMGIISYLKYDRFTNHSDPRVLQHAIMMGDFIVNWTLTPPQGVWANFTRSTGFNMHFPLDYSTQSDIYYGLNVIEPDKGGIAGYALLLLYQETGEERYLVQSYHNAELLADMMLPSPNATSAPWPFRVDSITGEYESFGQPKNGNMVYILRLFRALADIGFVEFLQPATDLWTWIRDYQIAAPDDQQDNLWIQFFEDHQTNTNRNSWSPLETARYLLEEQDELDPDWMQLAGQLIDFTLRYFAIPQQGNVTTVGEQDEDNRPWGGAASKLGGVAMMYACAGGPSYYEQMSWNNLAWIAQFVDIDGCPTDFCVGDMTPVRGGWQEDCHTDRIHNFIDAFDAYAQCPSFKR